MTAAIALPLLDLSDDERELLGRLRGQITIFSKKNQVKQMYYEGKFKTRLLDIAVPPSLADLDVRCDHPATVADTLAERILWDQWTSASGNLLGLDRVFNDNNLGVEQSQATIDALICGVSFVAVGKGDTDEPEVLITAESPSAATVEWDARSRRATAALTQLRNEFGTVTHETLYLPNETIRLERVAKKLTVIDRDEHKLGRVAVARLTNQERAADRNGRSEITPAIRYYTDATVRTLLGMEINREFYTAPQRYGLGVDPEMFGLDESSSRAERVRRGWEISMTRMNFIPRDEETGELPQVGQFQPAPPTPYIEQIKHYAQMIASAAAIPVSHLGFATENPPSADAIKALESRLVKRAEFRQRMFQRTWLEIGRLALLTRDGKAEFDEEAFAEIGVNWLPASTPTPAADADRTGKLIESGVVPADSPVAARLAGLSKEDQQQLEQDRRRTTISRLASTLESAAGQARQDPQVAEIAGARGAVAE